MAEFKFIFKTFLATLAIIALMQIKVGEKTVESQVYQILAQSKFTGFLNEVARGAVHLGKEGKHWLEENLKGLKKP